MSIERRDERLGIAKERLKDGTQGRQEGGEEDGTALQDAQEIDPSGKDLSVTDEDECRRGGVAVRLKSSGHGLAQLHVQRVGLAMYHVKDAHVPTLLHVNHVPHLLADNIRNRLLRRRPP